MTKVEAAWLTGLFDGEGNILNPSGSKRYHSLRISITNTCYPLLERVVEVTATGSIVKTRDATDRVKTCWYWICFADNARSVLRQMMPWLIVKRERALAALADHEARGRT